MRVAQCCFRRYRLRFKQHVDSVLPSRHGHNGPAAHREGVIVTLRDGSGREGHGEIAPLLGLHREGLEKVIEALPGVRETMMGTDWSPKQSALWGQFDKTLGAIAGSVRCGVEMALADLLGAFETDEEVAVCGLMAADGSICEEVETLAAGGYKVAKVKVGRRPLSEDVEIVRRIRERLGGRIRLRLDANRAWGLDDAVEFCRRIGGDGIEYIEEPVVDPGDQGTFVRKTGLPIGLDETLSQVEPEDPAIAEGVAAVILKPAVIGGLSRTARWIAVAKRRGVQAVLSSCFESAVAVRAYAAMAARLGVGRTAQGLDTLKFLREDVAKEPPVIRGGCMAMERLTLRDEGLEEIRV